MTWNSPPVLPACAKWAPIWASWIGCFRWQGLNASDVTTNSNRSSQGINKIFKSMNSPAPPAGLNVIWVKGSSLRVQILCSCPCETWASYLSSLNLSFLNWKMRSSKPYKVVVSISGKNRCAVSRLEPRIHLHLLSAGHWDQQLGLTAAPRDWKSRPWWERMQNWVHSSALPLPIMWPSASHPALLSLMFLSWEMGQ